MPPIEPLVTAPDRSHAGSVGQVDHPALQQFQLPRPWLLVRSACWHLAESFGLPLITFLVVQHAVGTSWALVAGVGCAWATIGGRTLLRAPVPAVLLISAVLLSLQTVIAFSTGDTWVYLLQPALAKAMLAVMFARSAFVGRPMIGQLAHELCALPEAVVAHDGLRAVFLRLTVFWSALFALLAGGMAAMVVTLSVAGFLLTSTAATLGLILVGAAFSLHWFRRHLRRAGLRLGFAPAGPALSVPD